MEKVIQEAVLNGTILGSECVLSQLFCLYEFLSLILTERNFRKKILKQYYIMVKSLFNIFLEV